MSYKRPPESYLPGFARSFESLLEEEIPNGRKTHPSEILAEHYLPSFNLVMDKVKKYDLHQKIKGAKKESQEELADRFLPTCSRRNR